MTPGRHARRRTKRARHIRSAVVAFGVITLCAVAIGMAESRHGTSTEAATRSTGPSKNGPSAAFITTTSAPDSSAQVSRATSTRLADSLAPTTISPASGMPAALQDKVVVIDPGHNGGNGSHTAEINRQVPMAEGRTKECDTTGTESNDGYSEHAFTFDLATRIATDLRERGATVYLTRSNDTGVGPCVDERAASGGNHDADVAISIHADGGPADGRGFHVMPPAGCQGCNNGIVEPSAAFATILRDTFRAKTPMPVSTYLGSSGIMPRSDLAGINLSTVPKVFLECGNMRNSTDAELLKDPVFRQTAAVAISDGITLYLTSR